MATLRRWLASRLFSLAFRLDPAKEYGVGVDFDEVTERKQIYLHLGMVTIHVPLRDDDAEAIAWQLGRDTDSIIDEIAEGTR